MDKPKRPNLDVGIAPDLLTFLSLSKDLFCSVKTDGTIQLVNSAVTSILGYRQDEVIGRPFLSFVYPEDRPKLGRHFPPEDKSIFYSVTELRHVRRDGRLQEITWRYHQKSGDDTLYCVGHDLSEQKHITQLLKETEERFLSLFEHHPDGTYAFDLDARVTSASYGLSLISGYPLSELYGRSLYDFVLPENALINSHYFSGALAGEAHTFETVGVRKDGSQVEVLVTQVPMFLDGKIVGVHGIVKDISASKEMERRASFLARHDVTTGLANRTLLTDLLSNAIARCGRHGEKLAVISIDIERFRLINDNFGGSVGDHVLRTIGARLQASGRQGDTVSRMNSDEFIVLAEAVSTRENASAIARKIQEVVREPLSQGDAEITVECSIGIALCPEDGETVDSILQSADAAMYEAKSTKRGTVAFYTPSLHTHAVDRFSLEHRLRKAIDNDELMLYYQPKSDLRTGLIVGAEALVRWRHPEKGMIMPSEFIPLAEEVGLIEKIGAWVLGTACSDSRSWQRAGYKPIKVSVNVSAQQLSGYDSIYEKVVNTSIAHGLDLKWLDLEITESSLMRNVEPALGQLYRIRSAGATISIDDFGTGYSSLSYLKRLPIDTIKIDQSFIREVVTNSHDSAIVAATIAMAHALGMKVVAEGVTTADQVAFLKEHDCDEAQGYLFSYPVPEVEFRTLLDSA